MGSFNNNGKHFWEKERNGSLVSLFWPGSFRKSTRRKSPTAILQRKGDARKENSWIVLIRRVPAPCMQARRGGSRPRFNSGSPLFTVAGKVEREKEKKRGSEKERERGLVRFLPLLAILVVPQCVMSLASRRPWRTTPLFHDFVQGVPASLDFSSSSELRRSDYRF